MRLASARPSPAPAPYRAGSARKKGSKTRSSPRARCPRPCPDRGYTRGHRRWASTRTLPSAGVCRTALTSRFCITRATRGEQAMPSTPSARLTSGRPFSSRLQRHRCHGVRHDLPRSRAVRLGLDRARVELGELEQIVDHRCRAGGPIGASRARIAAGSCGSSTTPSSIASTIARRRRERRPEVVRSRSVIRSRRVASASRSRCCATCSARPCRRASRRACPARGRASSRPDPRSRSPSPTRRAVAIEPGHRPRRGTSGDHERRADRRRRPSTGAGR